jgi:hypothetical protein
MYLLIVLNGKQKKIKIFTSKQKLNLAEGNLTGPYGKCDHNYNGILESDDMVIDLKQVEFKEVIVMKKI